MKKHIVAVVPESMTDLKKFLAFLKSYKTTFKVNTTLEVFIMWDYYIQYIGIVVLFGAAMLGIILERLWFK